MFEYQSIWRAIYMDGRPHPDDVAEYPYFMGYSTGRWDGETLVVDTTGIDERSWLDTAGHEHSAKLRLTERFRKTGPDTMEWTATFDDPVFFTRPWSVTRTFKRGKPGGSGIAVHLHGKQPRRRAPAAQPAESELQAHTGTGRRKAVTEEARQPVTPESRCHVAISRRDASAFRVRRWPGSRLAPDTGAAAGAGAAAGTAPWPDRLVERPLRSGVSGAACRSTPDGSAPEHPPAPRARSPIR